MTRSPQELAQTVSEVALGKHPTATARTMQLHYALNELVALAEAGERAQEALRQIVGYEWMVGNEDVEMGDLYRAVCDCVARAIDALGEGS